MAYIFRVEEDDTLSNQLAGTDTIDFSFSATNTSSSTSNTATPSDTDTGDLSQASNASQDSILFKQLHEQFQYQHIEAQFQPAPPEALPKRKSKRARPHSQALLLNKDKEEDEEEEEERLPFKDPIMFAIRGPAEVFEKLRQIRDNKVSISPAPHSPHHSSLT